MHLRRLICVVLEIVFLFSIRSLKYGFINNHACHLHHFKLTFVLCLSVAREEDMVWSKHVRVNFGWFFFFGF